MKIVLDTNVLIAAFYNPPHRPCFSRDVFDYVVEKDWAYLSPYILSEFRVKCLKKLDWAPDRVQTMEDLIKRKAHVEDVHPARWLRKRPIRLRDEKDRPILDFALAINANLILTWDKDLLILKKAASTKIITPREFWDLLR